MATKINPVTGALDYYEQALPPFRNKIYNGEMRIDQRNNGSSVTPASGEFTVDRWVYEATQSSKAAFQQVSTAPTGFVNSAKLTSNSAYTVAAGDVFQIVQRIEGSNISELAWGTATASNVTLSFKAYSSLTGTFGGFLRNSANDRYYIFTYSIPVANTWTDISITIPGDTTGTWLTTNGYGLGVGWSLGSGSNYQTTAGSWGSGNKRGATGQVDLVATNGATFYITGAQLEIGASATPFEHRPIGTELSLCQRYYQKSQYYSNRSYDFDVLGLSVERYDLKVTMRSAPSTDLTISTSEGSVSGLNLQTSDVNYVAYRWSIAGATGNTYAYVTLIANSEL